MFGNLAVENQLHVSSAFELLENDFIHAAVGVDERGGNDRQGTCLLGVPGRGKDPTRDFHGAGIDPARHGASA